MKITKKQQRIIDGYKVGSENETITNPYSKISVVLCPEAVAMYDIIRGCEISLHNSYNEKTEELFYTARDIFRANWPEEYMALID